ncbi:hypothetical protein [Amorphus sp. 3PC139-8]|uniref:hypothetical protein n=1 Tax=Amorphus sp. 3PC139-8 TaxID=2735676 RepID=UPI00345D33C1
MTFVIRVVELAAAIVILAAAWFAIYRTDEFRSYFSAPAPEIQAPASEPSLVERQILETVQSTNAALHDASAAIEHLTRQLAATNAQVQDLSAGADSDARAQADAVLSTNDQLLSAAAEVQTTVKSAAVTAGAQADLANAAVDGDEEAAVAALMQPDGAGGAQAVEPRWGVVFGAELTREAADRMLERAQGAIGSLEATLYRRNGFYRGVAEFPTRAAALKLLANVRERVRPDAYLVALARWCPGAARDADEVTCED